MEAGTFGIGVRGDYTGLGLRTRCRRHQEAGCHTPGCWRQALKGKRFCKDCQQTLDRVRNELKAGNPRARKRLLGVGSARARSRAAASKEAGAAG